MVAPEPRNQVVNPETLKRYVASARSEYPRIDDVAQIGLSVAEVDALIAALEDRERLRKVEKAAVNLVTSRGRTFDETAAVRWATVRRDDFDRLRSALEGRDG